MANENLANFNSVDLLFPGRYMKASDLASGKAEYIIDHIEPRHELQRSNGAVDKKPVITLRGVEKKWTLNKTNALSLAKALNEQDVTKWIGKRVVLYPARVAFGSGIVDAVRVDEAETARRNMLTVVGEPPHNPATGEVLSPQSQIAELQAQIAKLVAATQKT